MAKYKVLAVHNNGKSGWSTSVKASGYAQAVDNAFNQVLNSGVKAENEELNVLCTNELGMKAQFKVSVCVNGSQTSWTVREAPITIADDETSAKKKRKVKS